MRRNRERERNRDREREIEREKCLCAPLTSCAGTTALYGIAYAPPKNGIGTGGPTRIIFCSLEQEQLKTF